MTDRVLMFFKDICALPHGSGNCSLVGDYLVDFAKNRGLYYFRDKKGNVLIKAPAVLRDDSEENTVILQGHQDMVCVKEESCDIDMSKEPLRIEVENGIISAKGTSLGADDGIGVAMALAVLDNKELVRPPIEAVFTVDEETGMSGAAEFDMSLLKGRKLINLDSEEEGVVTCACAGGERIDVRIPLSGRTSDYAWIKIEVSGLQGGHSGCDIHKGRLSAIRVITDILGKVNDIDLRIAQFSGGRFDNVICSQAYAVILVNPGDKEKLYSKLLEIRDREFLGYIRKEKMISVDLLSSGQLYDKKGFVLGTEETKQFLNALNNIPQGVVRMMGDRPESVETSMNIGTVEIFGNELKITFSLRSSIDEKRKELREEVSKELSMIKGCTYKIRDPYPAWKYVPSSPLRDTICSSYKELFGKEMNTAVTHGGLECGYFASGIKDCELVSIGPDIDDIHSVKEKISIDSIDRCFKLLVKTLEKI